MRIQSNIAALNTSKNLAKAQKASQSNIAKLSSGYAINKAADNASGLAVSEKMRSQIRGLKQASKNATDGINLISTAEGYMSTANDILQRMRELAVQSANGTYDGNGTITTALTGGNDGDTNRAKINEEIQALTDELDRISNTANFNGMKLSTPNTTTNFTFQVGANTNTPYANNGAVAGRQGTNAETITVSIGGFDSTTLGVNANSGTGTEQTDAENAAIAAAKAFVSENNINLGTAVASDDYAGWKASIVTATDQKYVKDDGSLDAIANNPELANKLAEVQGLFAQADSTANTTGSGIDLTSQASANLAIDKINNAISKVSGYRAQLGAAQSRLEYTVDNISTSVENTTASESAIRDTDMVSEMMDFTKNNVLSQAATAMMAQANSQTQSVLQLLQ